MRPIRRDLGPCLADVTPSFERGDLPLQLPHRLEARGIEIAVRDGHTDRAPGFAPVTAVPEAAARREPLDIGEDVVERRAVVPDAHGAQARRVDEERTRRQHEQLARGRRVSPALIVGSRRADVLPLRAQQGVRDRGFPDTGRAEEADGEPRCEVLDERREAVPGQRAHDVDLRVRGDASDGRDVGFEVGRQVRLVEHDDRPHAARSTREQVALDPTRVEVAAERGHEQGEIDVRREDLGGHVARRPVSGPVGAGQDRQARQDRPQGGGTSIPGHGLECEPVPDDRVAGARRRLPTMAPLDDDVDRPSATTAWAIEDALVTRPGM